MPSTPGGRCRTRRDTVMAGALILIGGGEDKEDEMEILREGASHAADAPLVVATLASKDGQAQWARYERTFHRLSVHDLVHLHLDDREEADDMRNRMVREAGLVFFTGGDQLRITSKFGGTGICQDLREAFAKGTAVAGTSSGASVMSATMLIGGRGDESHRI